MSRDMPTPNPRFTGLFIPSEILNIPDLSSTDFMLLSWIDALYHEDYKGCFASNAWFAQKLHLKENTVKILISKLKDLGLVEQVSFDGRIRVLRACKENWHRSTSDVDLNQPQTLKKINPRGGKKSTPLHTIYRKEEIKEKPPVPPQASELASFLLISIQAIKQDIKIPDLEKWSQEINRMIKIDKRSFERIKEVIGWLPNNEFWSKNILSAGKLREKFDQLEIEMSKKIKTISKVDQQTEYKPSEEELKQIKEAKEYHDKRRKAEREAKNA